MDDEDIHHHHDHDHDHDADGRCVPRGAHVPLRDYHRNGVRFQFPSNWELSEQATDDETTISVQSEGTSFWTLALLKSRPDPDQVLDTVVDMFEEDYEDVDVTAGVGSLGGLPALTREIDFVCYDLVNSASLRVCQTSEMTVMVLHQGTDHELVATGDQLRAMTASLQCDDEQ